MIATCLWGVWGFLGKLASRSVAYEALILLGTIGGFLVFPVYMGMFHREFKFEWNSASYYYAILAGVVGNMGGLFFYRAISKGEASRVVVMTATYPVLTVLLSIFILREEITTYKILGICLAIAGIYFLSR